MGAPDGRRRPRGSPLRTYDNSGFRAETSHEAPQIRKRQRHATGRRRTIRPREVKEYGTTPPRDTRAGVVVDLDEDVVEVILAPQTVARLRGRAAERTVVAAVGGILAPSQIGRNASCRKQRAGPGVPIRSPPQAKRPKTPARGRAVALELVGAQPSPPEHDGHRAPADEKNAPAAGSRPRAHPNKAVATLWHRANIRRGSASGQ